MRRYPILQIVFASILLALTGCGGGSSAGSEKPVTWRLEVANLPFDDSIYSSPSSTPGRAIRLRGGVDTAAGLVPMTLEEVDYSTGLVTRSVEVFNNAAHVSVSTDGTQAYVYRLGGADAGEGQIQRVALSTFTVSANYMLPISSNSYLSELEVNPSNPLEIVVLAFNRSSGNVLGPLCYRNDALLPLYPPDSPQTPRNLFYVGENAIWGSRGAGSGFETAAYSVGSLGVSKVQGPNLGRLQSDLLFKVGNALIGYSGLILSYPSLSMINVLSPQMRSYNTIFIQGSPESKSNWFAGYLPDHKLDVVFLSEATWNPLAEHTLSVSRGENLISIVVLRDSSAIIQTNQRKLLIRAIQETTD